MLTLNTKLKMSIRAAVESIVNLKLQLKGKHEEDNTSKKVSSEVYLGSNSKLFRGIIIWIENFLVGHVIDVCD